MNKLFKRIMIVTLAILVFASVLPNSFMFAITPVEPFTYQFTDTVAETKLKSKISLTIDKADNIVIKEIKFKDENLIIQDDTTKVLVEKDVDTNGSYNFEVSYIENTKEVVNDAELVINDSQIPVKDKVIESEKVVKKQVLTYEVKSIEVKEVVKAEVKPKVEKEVPNIKASAKTSAEETHPKFFIFAGSDKSVITGYVTTAQDVGTGTPVMPPRNVVIPKSYLNEFGETIEISGIGNDAFAGMSTYIDSITLNDNLKTIGDKAFYNMSSLTSIIIPNMVKTIGDSAFVGCSGLTRVIIGSGSIGNSAFSALSGLTSVSIGIGVTSIGDNAFEYCSGLTSITIPNSVTSIGSSAFYGCSRLTSITIPDGVTSIGSSTFAGCSGLTSISIPDIVTSIGEGAFMNCYGLTSITIPNSVTSIEDYTFEFCSGLTSITIPDSVTSIEDRTFKNCHGLTSITIPNAVTSIGDNAFEYCSGLTSITIPDGVTSIGDSAFSGCSGLTSITIPNSVTIIGDGAFSLTKIKTIEIDKNFNEITGRPWGANIPKIIWKDTNSKPDCFYYKDGIILGIKYEGHAGCKDTAVHTDGIYSLPDIINGEKTIGIGDRAFANESNVKKVIIPNTVKTIGDSAFSGCSGLTSVTISDGLTSIGVSTFSGCSGLTSITIPDGVTSIGVSTFFGCSGLTSITIPDSVTSIEDRTFKDCYGLTSITIPNAVTSIGDNAFRKCSVLTSITIPDSVTSIGVSAFSFCSGLRSIILPKKLTSIENNAFDSCSSLTSISIPDSVTSIGNNAFYSCSKLTSINIPDSVTSIGSRAFLGTKIKTFNKLSKNIKTIGAGAFDPATEMILLDMPRATAPISLTENQPWGATKANTYFKGEFIDFSYTAEKKEYDRIIHYKFDATADTGLIQAVTLPNGSVITSISNDIYEGTYTIDANETFDISVLSSSATSFPYQVTIDDIGKVDLQGNDFSLKKSALDNTTKIEELFTRGAVKATDIDQDKDLAVSYSNTLEEIKTALTKDKDSIKITLTTTNDFGTIETKLLSLVLMKALIM